MNLNYIERDKKKQIILYSDAFPKNINGKCENKIYALSEIHDKIMYEDLQFNLDEIQIKEISKNDLSQIVRLHREWFPIDYSNDFFTNLFSSGSAKVAKNIIALGAFVKVDEKEYIVGSILCEIKTEKKFYNSTKIEIPKKSFYERLFNSYEFCYIMTIGVIDECRNLGLGSRLLREIVYIIKQQRRNCLAIFLHVIEYNTVAIRFYLKNEFIECNNLRNYYFIDQKYYNAKVLYKLLLNEIYNFNDKELFSKSKDSISDENIIYNSIIELSSLISKLCCCVSKKK